MLKRREKKRYIAIYFIKKEFQKQKKYVFNEIKNRAIELFGLINIEKSSLRYIEYSRNERVLIIRSALGYEEMIIASIAVLDLPLFTVSMSGTLRKLREEIELFGNIDELE